MDAMKRKPDAEDDLVLFGRYRQGFGDVYLATEDERFRLLFDQVCRLLAQPSPFRATARRCLDGDAATVAHMTTAQNRHFMLSDLFDDVHLVKTMGGSWNQRGP